MENEEIFEVTVHNPKTSKENGFTTYEIVCITDNKKFKNCYSRVQRRYSEFRTLHSLIKRFVPGLPEFPGKAFKKFSEELIKTRQIKLNIYMKFVAEIMFKNGKFDEIWAKELIRFLQDELYKPKYK